MKKMHKRVAALLMAAVLTGVPAWAASGSLGSLTVWAEETEGSAEPLSETQTDASGPKETAEAAPEETEEAVTEEMAAAAETATEAVAEGAVQPQVQITITSPEGWQAETVQVGIQVEDTQNSGNFSIAKVEARISEDGGWMDVTQSMAVDVTANCSVYVRVTDQNGATYEQNRYVECFDKTKPTLSAAAKDGILLIRGADEGSGIAAIYVNGNEFTELNNDTLSVRLQKADTAYQTFTLQARDKAGNMSETYKVANPYYEDPDAVNETADGTGSEQQANSLPSDVTATAPTSATATVTEHQTTGETSDTSQTEETEETDSTETGRVQGEAAVQTASEGGKEFYTIQTKSDKVFYLIIDKDKTDENVYLLTEVGENDLLNFTDSNTVTLPQNSAVLESALPLETVEDVEETESEITEEPQEVEEPEKEKENNSGTLLLMALILLAVGGGYYYVKFVKGKNGSFSSDYEEEDDEDYEEEETVRDEEDHGEEIDGQEDEPEEEEF